MFFFNTDTVEGRRRQAKRRNILQKARVMLAILGERRYSDDQIEITMESDFWKDSDGPRAHDDIKIWSRSTAQVVFQGTGLHWRSDPETYIYKWALPRYADESFITGYIPGTWEAHLDLISARAVEAREHFLQNEESASRQKTKINFGL